MTTLSSPVLIDSIRIVPLVVFMASRPELSNADAAEMLHALARGEHYEGVDRDGREFAVEPVGDRT